MDNRTHMELLKLAENASPEDKVQIDRLLEEKCFYPDCDEAGTTGTQHTAYVDDLSNYCCYCPEHKKVNDEYWEEMWADYYRGVL